MRKKKHKFRPSIFSLLTVFIVILAFNTTSCFALQNKTSKYLIPKDYVGWVRIYYGIKDAPALPISDDGLTYTHKIQRDGKLITSTIKDFDSRSIFYFYDNAQEKEIFNSSSVAHGLESGSYDIPCIVTKELDDAGCKGSKTSYVMFYVGTDIQYQEAKSKQGSYLEFLKTTLSTDLKQ